MREFLRRATAAKIDRLSKRVTESFRFLLRKTPLVERVAIDRGPLRSLSTIRPARPSPGSGCRSGTGRFVRRVEPVSLRSSLQLYTARMGSDDLAAGTYGSAVLGLMAILYGAVTGDIALAALGVALMLWSCRLLGVLVSRWIDSNSAPPDGSRTDA